MYLETQAKKVCFCIYCITLNRTENLPELQQPVLLAHLGMVFFAASALHDKISVDNLQSILTKIGSSSSGTLSSTLLTPKGNRVQKLKTALYFLLDSPDWRSKHDQWVHHIVNWNCNRLLGILPAPQLTLKTVSWEAMNNEFHTTCGFSTTKALNLSKKDQKAVIAYREKLSN